jgi:hypothetical protein
MATSSGCWRATAALKDGPGTRGWKNNSGSKPRLYSLPHAGGGLGRG